MSNIDLQGMINQLMGITREAWDMKKRKLDEGLSGHEQTEARNWEIQKEQNKNAAALDLQAQSNEAALTQAKERTAGEIARQGMANEASRYTADQGLQGHKYTADTNLTMKREELSKGYDPELIKAHAAIIANVNSTPEAVASSQAAIDWYTGKSKSKGAEARQGLGTEQPAPAASSIPTVAPAVTAKRPTPTYDDGKDIKTPSIFDTQKNSMDFVSPVLREAQRSTPPPTKSLQEQDADYFNRHKSAAGVVINPMLSPGESARMRMGQDKINAAPKETEEERKKRQEQNRFRAGLS